MVVVESVFVVWRWVVGKFGWFGYVFVVVSLMACQVVWRGSLRRVWHGFVWEWMPCWWSSRVLVVVCSWKPPVVLVVGVVVVWWLVQGVVH